MRNRRRKGGAGTARSMGGQLLGLSLFIMLLAFFIVLNAISQFEEVKVRPVMQSLSHAFAANIQDMPLDEQPSVTEAETASVKEGDTVERLQALFTAQIPSHEAVVSERQGVMYVKVPFDDFEAAVMAVGQRNALDDDSGQAQFFRGFFLPTLVALLKTDTVQTPYRMDMMLNIDENPAHLQNQQPQRLADTMQTMSAIAEKIEAGGLPAKLLSSGVRKGEAGTIELLFRRHIPYSPVEGFVDE